MAESLLLPVVRGVAGKAGDELVQTVTRMCNVDEDRAKLERQLLAVQDILADAELKSKDRPAIKEWMKALRSVAYQADDVLDEFQYEALRRKAQIRESMKRKVLSYFTLHSPLLFRLKMSRKLKDVVENILKLVTEMNTFGLVAGAPVAPVVHREMHSGLDDRVKIVGRDKDKEEIVKLLLEPRDNQKLEVLPIVGMGGLGKTTLAQMVYNNSNIQLHFELRMWVCVSEETDVKPLLRSIIKLAPNGRCDPSDSIELLRERLQEALRRKESPGQKRCLLVLDDVWNEDKQMWELLRPLLCSASGLGSVIVVTTRSNTVASVMHTLVPRKLAYLIEDDSWELFRKKAFSGEVEEQSEFVTIGKLIVHKCKGLPLALMTMGGLMGSKQRVHEWEDIAESNIWDNVGGSNGIQSILELSYRHLSPEAKQCFTFCAVFPKDYQMAKDMLIQLWMANDFLQEEGTIDFEQKGEVVFEELVSRSFLQDVNVEKSFGHNSPMYTDRYKDIKQEHIVCKMHDLVHDLAKSITDECVNVQEFDQQKSTMKDVRHIMLSIKDRNKIFEDMTPLRTLLVEVWSIIPDMKSLNLKHLRVLYCNCMSLVEIKLINTRHLRYLDLSRSSIESLPDSICMFYNLQTLRLNACESLRHLPEGMRYISKLRHINLCGCYRLECMPPSIDELKNLRILSKFVVDTMDGCGIEELKDMQHLRGRLELSNLRKIKNSSSAKEANLCLKKNIEELVFFWGPWRDQYEVPHMEEDEVEVRNEEDVLEFLEPPQCSLKLLMVFDYGGTKISSWMKESKMFQHLKVLKISNCQRCNDLPIVWLSPSLENFKLEHMNSVTIICNGVDMEVEGCNKFVQIFPKLKRMKLHDLPNLETWAEDKAGKPIVSINLPKLERLKIDSCPKLASIPKAPVLAELYIQGHCGIAINSLAHLTRLLELRYEGSGVCDSMSTQVIPFSSWSSLVGLELYELANIAIPPEEQGRSPLESLRRLMIHCCNGFVSSDPPKRMLGFWDYFVFVEDLWITDCDDLVRWPEEELRSFNCLQSLWIRECCNFTGSSSAEAHPMGWVASPLFSH